MRKARTSSIVIMLAMMCGVVWLVVTGCGAATGPNSTPASVASAGQLDTGISQVMDTGSSTTTEDQGKGKVVYMRAKGSRVKDMAVYSLSELEDKSKAIVQVRVLDTTERGTQSSGSPRFGIHLTRVAVDEVFKSDGRIERGGTYTITEYYTVEPHPDEKDTTIIWVIDDHVPMDVGGEYVLFLVEPSHPELGDYEVYGLWWGQYKVSDKIIQAARIKDLSKEDIGAAHDYPGTDVGYWAIAQEVKDKYLSPR